MEEEQIEKEFDELIGKMNDDTFWKWIRSWYDEGSILSICKDWDTDIKEDSLNEMRELVNNQNGKTRN
jgi:hypothetical protein